VTTPEGREPSYVDGLPFRLNITFGTHTYHPSRLFLAISLTRAKNIDVLSFAASGYRVNISSMLVIKTGCFFDRRLQWSHAGSLWPVYTRHMPVPYAHVGPMGKSLSLLVSPPQISHGPGVPSPPRSAKVPRGRIPPRLSVSRTVEPRWTFRLGSDPGCGFSPVSLHGG
jgi:hypothetical protein